MKKSYKCYLHIKDIKLSDFITAHCDNDLSVLVLQGNPTEEELKVVWDKLFQQYVKAVSGSQFQSKLQDVKDYTLLESKIRRASMLLELYQVEEAHKMIAEMLESFKYPIGTVTVDNLHASLKRFRAYLKADIVKLNGMAKKLETKAEKDVKPTAESYYDTLVGIGEHLKVVLIPNEISVALYCSYVNQLNRHIENLIKQQNKTK